MTNPLLETWKTPFGLAPFAAIEDAHFEPAFDAALAEAQIEIRAIATNSEAPSFANTIVALEGAGKTFDQVLSVFYSVAGADSNPKREELMRSFSPRLAAYSAEIYANEALFARVETLWNARDELGLHDQEARLLVPVIVMRMDRARRRDGRGPFRPVLAPAINHGIAA